MNKSLGTSKVLNLEVFIKYVVHVLSTLQPLRAVNVLFSPMVSGWTVKPAGGVKSLSDLYLRNCKVWEDDTTVQHRSVTLI